MGIPSLKGNETRCKIVLTQEIRVKSSRPMHRSGTVRTRAQQEKCEKLRETKSWEGKSTMNEQV